MDQTPAQPTPPVPPTPFPTAPPAPAPMKKGGINPWMILSIVLLIVLIGGGVYIFGMNKGILSKAPMQAYAPTPTAVVLQTTPTTAASPTVTVAAGSGTVTGTLCYPSSVIPAGMIYAKDMKTNKEVTQAYVGSQAGGGNKYSLSLPAGTYHMKFTPTQYTNIVGYYSEYSTCVDTPDEPNCTGGKKNYTILPVNVVSGQTTAKINLCDYYYDPSTPPQY